VPLLDIGTLRLLRAGRILLHGDVARFTKQTIVFADRETLDVDAVILGTGFRPDFDEFLVDWREVCDENGLPHASGAPTALPGLYFCGQQLSRSGMLRQIGIEARRIAAHIAA
jgi:NAD(P)H-nitrite reductase large subunit